MFSIVKTLSIAGEGDSASRYVIIPMARLLDNNEIRKNNSVALVPLDAVEEGTSASIESEIHHRPAAAPDTPEEPQIGFRYDSTESFQEAMRYGRRSKLELLWRLGAIPYSRALDRRTLPWEVTDRAHITADTWGSIPGAVNEHTKNSKIHETHGESDPSGSPNPDRGALAYVKAGWVYRLFSGHKSQEEHNNEAVTLRNMNRIRGIIAFLERLDEKVARGEEGCFADEHPHNCGFTQDRLWNFDPVAVERLRQKYKIHRRDALEKVDRYERLIRPAYDSVAALLKAPGDVLRQSNAQLAATNATLLAMAGYLTSNATYSTAAADLIGHRFVRQTPLFYRQFDQREQLRKLQDTFDDPDVDTVSPGYTFPPFPSDQSSSWSAELAALMTRPNAPPLAYDPLAFDVSPNVSLLWIFCCSCADPCRHFPLASPSPRCSPPPQLQQISSARIAERRFSQSRHPSLRRPPLLAPLRSRSSQVLSQASISRSRSVLRRESRRARCFPRRRSPDGSSSESWTTSTSPRCKNGGTHARWEISEGDSFQVDPGYRQRSTSTMALRE